MFNNVILRSELVPISQSEPKVNDEESVVRERILRFAQNDTKALLNDLEEQ
ncbi:MAG: hypothetical protein Q8O55_12165 [Dehalococcoidales bacterium]|nr:hypothetical protein [Dehalococcoidales bacterium]